MLILKFNHKYRHKQLWSSLKNGLCRPGGSDPLKDINKHLILGGNTLPDITAVTILLRTPLEMCYVTQLQLKVIDYWRKSLWLKNTNMLLHVERRRRAAPVFCLQLISERWRSARRCFNYSTRQTSLPFVSYTIRMKNGKFVCHLVRLKYPSLRRRPG